LGFICSYSLASVSGAVIVGLGQVGVRGLDSLRLIPSSISKTYLPLATGHGDVDETTSVLEALHGAALGELLLLLGLDLYESREIVSLGFLVLKIAFQHRNPMQHRNQPRSISHRLPSSSS
jgi:hypothetical protein